jgi:hypothetical protein
MPRTIKKVDSKINGRETFTIDYFDTDTDKQVWLDNPHVDNLVSVVIAIGSEMWATKQRQIIAEKLAEKNIPATYQAIETYQPSDEEEKEWHAEREALAHRLYSYLARPSNASRAS